MISDPFYDELRRRHPDVDLVLLPARAPSRAARPPLPAVPLADARAAVRVARGVVAQVLPGAAGVERWAPTQDGRHRFTCFASRPGALDDLEAMGDALLARGLDARPWSRSADSEEPGIVAVGEGVVVEARLIAGEVHLDISAEPMVLAADDLMLLRTELHR